MAVSSNLPPFGASPAPKKKSADATASVTTTSATSSSKKKLEMSEGGSSSSGSGRIGMKAVVAATLLAALAIALAAAQWNVTVAPSSSSSSLPAAPAAVVSEGDEPPSAEDDDVVVSFNEDEQPLPGLHVDGGLNAPRGKKLPPWPALVRVERSRLKPRKPGAMERAIEELSALGVAQLVDEEPRTPWDILIPSKIGGLERLRINKLRKGQQVGTIPEPLSSRKNLALVAARSGWPNETVPRSFQLMSEYQDFLDLAPVEFPSDSKWILKSTSKGHARNGHESYSSVSTAASATMLPQATFELAQLELPPPPPPTTTRGSRSPGAAAAAHPSVFGRRHQLKLFVAVTSVQPPRAYVFEGGGVLTLRDGASVAQAVAKTGFPAAVDSDEKTSRAPFYAHWMGTWTADAKGVGADAVARQLGRKGARKLWARAADVAVTGVFRWLSLPGRVGDPHGDLQFSIAPGSAFEVFSVETVFSAPAGDNSTTTTAWVVDVKPASAERLGSDIDFLLSPAPVAGAEGCDAAVVGALRSALEVQLRRRERWMAKEAGACDDDDEDEDDENDDEEGKKKSVEKKERTKPSFPSPKAWSSAGDPCSHADDDALWEEAQAALLGWRRLDLAGSTAPKSLLDKETAEAAARRRRSTPRDAASIQAAAEALAAAVNGDVVDR